MCAHKRNRRPHAIAKATCGLSIRGAVYGVKLHALYTPDGQIVKFAMMPAYEADVTVARGLLEPDARSLTPGDKPYLGCSVYTPPKVNALNSGAWTRLAKLSKVSFTP